MNDPSRFNQFSPPHPLIGMPDYKRQGRSGGLYKSGDERERERVCVCVLCSRPKLGMVGLEMCCLVAGRTGFI